MGGTVGYVPPGCGQTWKATPGGDVYSPGVVLLELVTGKTPIGREFHESCGGNLVGWVRSQVKDQCGFKCLDPKLLASGVKSEMLETLRMGYLCTAELPTKRLTMQQVVAVHAIDYLVKVICFHVHEYMKLASDRVRITEKA
ncbi:probable LRR receptor-like serine/threonine-protein kinase At2g24230 [Physcomitrium patens]|uniref:probable LRR receptor-like serine/threonine-protein kinase At2g24230 n=1 Tax=Physcomitrium patens TaxID=3218 RepID=UPI003CCE1E76